MTLSIMRDRADLPQGCLPCASDMPWGFTPDRWTSDSYLWRSGNEIILSLLFSRAPGNGHLRELIEGIEADGLTFAISCPIGVMEMIVRHYGLVCSHDGDAEFWRRPFVSPYLERPLRSLEQARRDIERKERIDG